MTESKSRHWDEMRMHLTAREQISEINPADLLLGTYQVDVTILNPAELRTIAAFLLQDFEACAQYIHGYDNFYSAIKQALSGISSTGDIKKASYDSHIFELLSTTRAYLLMGLENASTGAYVNAQVIDYIFVTPHIDEKKYLLRVRCSVTRREYASDEIKIECRPVTIAEAIANIESWRDFIGFMDKLQALFDQTEKYMQAARKVISGQSIHLVCRNLFNGNPKEVSVPKDF